jgi:flagellar basal-body rod modification protein FlgD
MDDNDLFARLATVAPNTTSDGSLDVRVWNKEKRMSSTTAVNGNPLNNSTVPTTFPVGTVLNSDGSTSTSNTTGSLDQNDFLNLLVAQLKNQTPDSPADTSAMMQQEAQFSELNAVLSLQTSMTSMLQSSQSSQAAGMIGKSISADNPSGGNPITGVVTGTMLGTDGPTLLIGNLQIPMGSVTEVDAATSSSTTTPST